MEIKVNDYVKNKDGIIRKVISIEGNIFYVDKSYYEKNEIEDIYEGFDFMFDNEIVKHSNNIIDLLECGDYVNGKRVIYIDTIEDGDGNERLCVFVEETQDCIEKNEIKSIVTKEQFSSLEYII